MLGSIKVNSSYNCIMLFVTIYKIKSLSSLSWFSSSLRTIYKQIIICSLCLNPQVFKMIPVRCGCHLVLGILKNF